LRASEEIVDTYDVPTISEQSLTEMRAEKAGSPGNQYACFKMHTPEFPLDCPITACHIGRQFPTSKIRMQLAGCATPTGSAGHAGATANLKLTFHLDHSAGADQSCPSVR